MHVPNKAQVLLVAARFAYCQAPLLNCLEDLGLDPGRPDWGPFGKPADKLIEKLFRTDLEVERIAAVLDADIEQTKREQGDIGIAMVDEGDDSGSSFPWRSTLLRIDQISDLEVECKVRLVVLGAAGGLDEALELGRGTAAELGPAIAGGRPGRSRLHGQRECRGGLG